MQKCPFCEFNHTEMTLHGGRCPQCGSILEWPEEPESPRPTTETPTVVFPGNEPESLQPEPHPASAAPSPIGAMERMWRDSIENNSDVRSTLKGPNSQPTVTDSVFSILPREVRSPLHATDTPVDYELLDIIGQGGVGVVYSARQASIDRTVAIKMLREEYRSRADHKEKFLAEAVLTGELDHPNIVPIYDLGRNASGELFYSMKNVIGTPWDRVINQKSLRENIDILLKVADAIAFAHSRSVVHRDLKPENVMLGNFGEVLVMDWGIAFPTEGFRRTSNIRRSQAMGGTPAYMAPELVMGPVESIGPPADVYLLGAILFEILTGMPPHYGNDVMECVSNAAKNIIRETTVTGELMEIAVRAMATEPRRRFRSVLKFQAAIRLYQAHSESITLSESAEVDLQNAISNKDYQSFSHSVFAFQEAISLWDENELAKTGLSRAKFAYANAAIDNGDYDLGLSLLDPANDEHQPLLRKLRAAIAERDSRQSRFKRIRQLAALLAGFIFVAGSIAMTKILMLNADLNFKKEELQGQMDITEAALESEKKQKKAAEESKKAAEDLGVIAENRRKDAEAARRLADSSRMDSVVQKQRAEESSYFAEIGLVGASIQQNQFAIAAEILNSQAQSPAKSKIRHWEWGRHQYLVGGGSGDDKIQAVTTFPKVKPEESEPIESIDCSPDGLWVAIGKSTGECELWRRGDQQPKFTFRHGRTLTDLDFDATGKHIATCGVDANNLGSVQVWRLQADRPPEPKQTLSMRGNIPTTVAFSNDKEAQYLAAGDNRRIARVWRWEDNVEVSVLLGHLEAITSIAFAPDDQYVASSSVDRTVRLWKTKEGTEVQRFSGHQAAVFGLAFAPDGQTIASGGADRRVLVWDVSPLEDQSNRLEDVRRQLRGETVPAQPFFSFEGHTGTVQDLDFSRDGKLMVSSGNDNLVCVWRVEKSLEKSPVKSLRKSPLLVKLRGHGGWVRGCRFSRDGSEIVSGSDDRTWKIWRFNQYREQQVLGDGSFSILDARFSPAGDTVATADSNGRVHLWNSASGMLDASLTDGHEYLVNGARVTADGKLLATAAGDNTLRLWDIQRGTQIAMVDRAGRNGVFSLSANGKWLVASGDELGVCVWDLDVRGEPNRFRAWPIAELGEPKTPTVSEVTSVAISDDGKQVLVGDKNGTCEFWDPTQGKLLNKVFGHSEAIVASFFLPSSANARDTSSIAMTVSSDGSAGWWDFAATKEMPRERLRHFASVQTASVSPNRKYLVSSALLDQQKTRLWVWDLASGEKLATRERTGEIIQDIVFSSNTSSTVFVTTSDIKDSSKKIWRWNVDGNDWTEIGSSAMRTELWGTIPIDGDSKLLTYGGRGARLWGVQDNVELQNFRPSAAIVAMAFTTDGKELATASRDGTALIWNLQNPSKNKSSSQKLVGGHASPIRDLAFSPDDSQLITSGEDGRIVVWDVKSGQPKLTCRISEPPVIGNSIRFSPDGTLIALACDDSVIRLFESSTLNLKSNKLKGHSAAATCASFSTDGRWIVSGSQDKTIRIWSVSTGQEFAKLQGHSAPLVSVVFSSDGLRVLSASQDTTARLWDIDRIAQVDSDLPTTANEASGADLGEVLSLEFHSSETTAAEFSPDGRTILTAGMDGKAVLWPSERVPLSIRISNPNIAHRFADGLKRIDPVAVLCQPGTLDLDGAVLEVKFKEPDGIHQKLLIDQSDGLFALQNSKLVYQPTENVSIEIGAYSEVPDNGLKIILSKAATHAAGEQLVRHLALQSDLTTESEGETKSIVMIRFTDRNGFTGNADWETVKINQ